MPPPDPCADFRTRSDEALEDFRDASEDRDQAQEDLADTESFWDESTWGNVATAVGIGAACSTNPIGWVVCGLTWLGGTAAVVASEVDRAGDIEAAEKALARAERDYWKANNRWQRTMREEAHCRLHHQITGQPT